MAAVRAAAPVAPGDGLPARPPGPVERLALPAAVLAGALVALQQRANGELKTALGDALLTAVVSFSSGLVAVAAVVLCRSRARAALPLVRRTRWWERLGGLGGATLVAVGAAATPTLGVALLTVGLVAGQTGGGVLVDAGGLGPSGRHRLSAARLGGAVLGVAAVLLSVVGGDVRTASVPLLVLVVLAGTATALQQALNGRVRATTGDAAVATALNFTVGTGALLVGLALRAAVHGLATPSWPGPASWYLYTGGLLGAVFVATAAVVVKALGVLRLGLAVVAGQLVGAVLLDALAPVPGTSLHPATALGALLTLVAVAVSGRGVR